VKRSGRDEPMGVIIHMCMEVTLEVSLHFYLKLAKTLFFIIFYVFSSRKSKNKRVEQVLPRSKWCGDGGEGGQVMYMHVKKYKNDKIKLKNSNHNIIQRIKYIEYILNKNDGQKV
jgi:hypothetical protein